MPTAAVLSFRFTDTDGVSAVARTWIDQLRHLGFDVVTIAGVEPADRVVDGLGLRWPHPPSVADVTAALADIDLTVVENLATIPLNVAAAQVVGQVLAGRPAIMHHHDPPWHRPQWRDVTELPIHDEAWRHVVLTETARREFAERGWQATVIRNAFGEPQTHERGATRAALGVADDERLVVHPVRAIERKGVPAAIALTEALGGTYWLLGPAEDGYGPTLDVAFSAARCRVIHRAWPRIDDVYAAADLVAYPSTWEGFGNPPVEAALRHRWTAIGDYPVAQELRSLGFEFADPTRPDDVAALLEADDRGPLERNAELARREFSTQRMADDLQQLLDEAGWLP